MRGLVLVLIAVVASGCVTARGRADRAFDRADYLAAAEQYAELAERAPGDASLRGRRDEARARALVTLAARARQLRLAGHGDQALVALAGLLSRRHAWPEPSDAAAVSAVTDELVAATAYLHGEIQRMVADGQPLGAEEVIALWRHQLGFSELETLWPALVRDAHEGGDARCRAAVPDDIDQSPYRARLAAAYCAHFGIAARSPAHMPERLGGVSIDGAVSGMTEAQRARLDAALDRGLRQTVWFDPDATGTGAHIAHIALTGHLAVAYGAAPVERAASWSETVHYTEQESYQEPYQESYQESYQQSYTVQVPYTEYRTESYSCGYGSTHSTCSRSVSSTSYRSETRYQTAHRTAFRTAYRTAHRTVTKSRSEPRVFTYAATERTGSYSGSWSLSVELGGDAAPLEVRVEKTDRVTGDDHDASFAQAHVMPSRAQLPSFDDWFAQLLGQLSTAFPAQLARHWSTSFCQAPSFDAEAAARCAYAATAPPAARRELARLFGNDVDRVLARFAAATTPR